MSFRKKILYLLYQLNKSKDFLFFDKLRSKIVNKLIGENVNNLWVRANVSIYNFDRLQLGNDVSINHGCFLSCYGGVTMGDFVAIGHNTSIISSEHGYADPSVPIKYQPVVKRPVKIGNNVWIGANVTILGGVTIADGTIIAAGAVVKKSVTEENSIVAGVPARFIKYYNE